MTGNKRDAGNLKLLGGRLCLDFVNTLDWRGTDNPQEFLNTFHDLAIWSRYVGLCTHQEFRQLSLMADRSKKDAKKVQSRAVKLRETIYRIFSANIENRDLTNEDLKSFNTNFARSMKTSQITKTRVGFTWDTTGDKTKLDWILMGAYADIPAPDGKVVKRV